MVTVFDAATTVSLRHARRRAAARAPPTGWEVLMGQSEVVNWLRSSPAKKAIMRYPGEFKFPGGTVDNGETLAQTALRERQARRERENFGRSSADGLFFRVKNTVHCLEKRGHSIIKVPCLSGVFHL